MKTRSHANRLSLILVASLWMLTILACSRSIQYQQTLGTPIADLKNPVLAETPVLGDTSFIGGGSASQDVPTFLPLENESITETPIENIIPEIEVIPPTLEPTDVPTLVPTEKPPILYYSQSGDTLELLSIRFGVNQEEIIAPSEIRMDGMLMPNQLFLIPDRLGNTTNHTLILPDSSVIYSPSAIEFDTQEYVQKAGGYLSTYKEWGKNGWRSGADVIQQLSTVNSINPMLLLAILEYQSNWVTSDPSSMLTMDYPIGNLTFAEKGLYEQINWAIKELSIGYYHWRAGDLTTLTLKDGTTMRLAPELNAGSVAIMYMFAQIMDNEQWDNALYGSEGIAQKYQAMFDDPWVSAQRVEPLFAANLAQPLLELPFETGHVWSFTGGPHSAWDEGGALAALDFAPSSMESGCVTSTEWVTAVADGLIIKSENGIVMLDLDGDSHEETGWVILYLHIASNEKISNGMWVKQGDRIGHPSCEGGKSTGTHVHIARRYNGEWILADQQIPFILSGWETHAGNAPYEGALIKDDTIVSSSVNGTHDSNISR